MTTFDNKCAILADFWLNYRSDVEFEDFVAYNDLGLPLAYAVDMGIADKNNKTELFVNETFEGLLTVLGIDEDTGFESIEDVMSA